MAGLNVNGLRQLGRGGEATVYALDRERVVRLFKLGTRREDVTRRTKLLRELAVGALDAPFAIPVVLEQAEVDGQHYTIEERLAGVNMQSALTELTGEARERLIVDYLDAATHVSTIRIKRPFFGELCQETAITADDWQQFLIARAQASLASTERTGRDVPALVAQLPQMIAVNEAQLVHLDYCPANVLVSDGRVSAVLDFGYACVLGDGRFNPCLAAAYLTLGRTPEVAQADVAIAHDWLKQQRLEQLFRPIATWMAMYWMMVPAADDPVARAWCLTYLSGAETA